MQADDPSEDERSGESGLVGVKPLRQCAKLQLPFEGKPFLSIHVKCVTVSYTAAVALQEAGFVQDGNTILEMFQRSFSADEDMDEAVLLQAANDWEDPPEDMADQHGGTSAVNPGRGQKSLKEYFSR